MMGFFFGSTVIAAACSWGMFVAMRKGRGELYLPFTILGALAGAVAVQMWPW